MRAVDVAIVGAGASGILTAVQLLRQAREPITLLLIERRAEGGPGVAYSTRDPSHLLNVPADKMSALPGDPDHFVRWMRRRAQGTRPEDFVERARYGQYLEAILLDAERDAAPGARLLRLAAEVTDVERVGRSLRVICRDGAAVGADAVVLALGNRDPPDLPVPDGGLYRSDRYLRSPWSPGALGQIPGEAPVILLGTGLTAVDAVLTLRHGGHRGAIHAVSRHGLLPREHARAALARQPPSLPSGGTLRGLVSRVRHETRGGGSAGWREVLDALRPATGHLWRGLPPDQQRRFLRHVRPFWETHRHRLPPQVALQLDSLQSEGLLVIHAARVLSFRLDPRAVEVTLRPRGAGRTEVLRAGFVVNCTGPALDMRDVRSPLLLNLLSRGLARVDELGLGLDWDDQGALLDANGRQAAPIYGIGPMRRSQLWESTAIPEIRVQAEELARGLLSLQRRRDEELGPDCREPG